MASEESRKLNALRVVDLRLELEKRSLDKSGKKQALMGRLQKAMQSKNLDPATHVFDIETKSAKTLSASLSSVPEKQLHHKDEKLPNNPLITEKAGPKLDTTTATSEELGTNEICKTDLSNNVGESNRITLEDNKILHVDDEGLYQEEQDNKQPKQEDVKKIAAMIIEQRAVDVPVKGEKKKEIKKKALRGLSKNPFAFAKKMSEKNLWIMNIVQNTRAADLKQAMAVYGKVIGAKVVINAKYPGACCYGYVTMETVKDAESCIANLHNTEFNGQIISVEKVRPDHMIAAKLGSKGRIGIPKPEHVPRRTISNGNKRLVEKKRTSGDKAKNIKKHKATGENSPKKFKDNDDTRSRHTRKKGECFERNRTSKSHRDIVLTFEKIQAERERQRLHEKERLLREENRRCLKEAARQRGIDNIQRLEAARLDREREKLRMEREKLEKDRTLLFKLERERQKVEREKIEHQKLEIQRARLRLQEDNRRGAKRSSSFSHRREESYDRKRSKRSVNVSGYNVSRDEKNSRHNEGARSLPYRREDKGHQLTREQTYSQGKDPRLSNTTWNHAAPLSSKGFNANSSQPPIKLWGSTSTPNRWFSSNSSRTMSSFSNVKVPILPVTDQNSYTVNRNRFDFKPLSNKHKY